MYIFLFYFLLFFIYAIMGWIVEVIYVSYLDKKVVNRGFLVGPYLPIYGTSAIVMIFYLNQYRSKPITVFILAMVVCTFLEYITSYILEKLFKARWWDYSNLKFNINGRVCLKNSLLFGILSLLLIYVINPFMINILDKMNDTWLIVISLVCLIIFIIDITISVNVILKIKRKLSEFKFDATMEIRKLVDTKIKKRYLQNRVFSAFPRVKFFSKNKD